MTTMQFSTVGIDSVYLYFNHIAKVDFLDRAIIEVSSDGGLTWVQLRDDEVMPPTWNNCLYHGASLFSLQSSKFSEASYAVWQPGQAVVPQPDWWRREIFDVSTLLGNTPNAAIRFVLADIVQSSGASLNTWYIDDILVTDSLDTYLYTFMNAVKGKVYFDMNSNQVQDAGDSPLSWIKVQELNSPNMAYTNSNGEYELLTLNSGSPIEVQLDSSIIVIQM